MLAGVFLGAFIALSGVVIGMAIASVYNKNNKEDFE